MAPLGVLVGRALGNSTCLTAVSYIVHAFIGVIQQCQGVFEDVTPGMSHPSDLQCTNSHEVKSPKDFTKMPNTVCKYCMLFEVVFKGHYVCRIQLQLTKWPASYLLRLCTVLALNRAWLGHFYCPCFIVVAEQT